MAFLSVFQVSGRAAAIPGILMSHQLELAGGEVLG